ncbi:MAG TPA: UDP-N-acetylmuramoyl-L-alanyl-D-glutamate--2,6-diaminopimelate ligase [Longimicrobiales bacterium]|nr:UDP-N-acetylmuramoyl-L-alanyl-D-glutamate--2,6-diaminopimelate ligase [Longimicrobiales bacterium]
MMEPRAPAAVPLSQVIARLKVEALVLEAPQDDPALTGVSADSRSTTAGDLFCAWSGTHHDSHGFVATAVESGAVAALVERRVEAAVPQVIVASGRHAAALAADEIMGRPAEGLMVVGVTGTNGKTTTVWILRHLLSGRWSTASLGTVGAVLEGGVPLPGTESLTTPGPVGMARAMRAFRDHGAVAVAMEVSSHALDQGRVHALRFSAAVFTNLTRDHLDYHGSLERYRATKREFVDLLAPDGVAVINAEDPAWDGLERRAPRALRFALEGGRGAEDAEVVARDVRMDAAGSSFRLTGPGCDIAIRIPLVGAYNVQNAIAAAATCLGVGLGAEEIARALADAPQVPGRLEQIADRPCRVVTDYAHTPDALERVLSAVRAVADGRVIVVFGAGGDRDAGKRPLMGEVAARLADVVVVTSDNPRTEDPDRIIDAIMAGVGRSDALRVTDRREAIGRALELAREDDVVLLAGKGHETYQVLGTETVSFDEREIVRAWIEGKGTPA